MHDALAVAHVIDPTLLHTERLNVEIDVTQGPCRGRTVVDQLRGSAASRTPHVALDVDAERFIDLLTGRIGSLPHDRVPVRAPARGAPRCATAARSSASGRPSPSDVRLRVGGADHALEHAGYGIYEATVDAAAGDDYEFVLDGTALPDPCSRWQPDGLRGPSRIVDPIDVRWTDGGFRTPGLHDAVLYELHIGTFSPEGTFDGAIAAPATSSPSSA